MARCEGCKRVQVNLNSVDSDCIALTGNGTTVPFEATPILDPDPANTLACGPAGLTSIAPPDLFAEGGVPAGTVPPVIGIDVVGPGPDWPNYCPTPAFMVPWGPQADVLVTNPTDYSFTLWGDVYGSPVVMVLDPGSVFQVGWALQITGINLPPAPITYATANAINGGIRNVNNGTTTMCTANDNEVTPIPAGFITLAPGDFLWVSLQAIVAAEGAPGLAVAFVSGLGPQMRIRGSRL